MAPLRGASTAALVLGVIVLVGGVGAGLGLMAHTSPDCAGFACQPQHTLFRLGLGVAAGGVIQAVLFFLLSVVLQGMYEMRDERLRGGVDGVASGS